MELNLARDVKDNKKGFFSCISSKRKSRGNVGLMLNGVGALVVEDTRELEFSRVTECLLCFSLPCQCWPSGIPDPEGKKF